MFYESKIKVKYLDEKEYKSCYITVNLMDVADEEEISKIYDSVYKLLQENKMQIVYEKIFGRSDFEDIMFLIRKNTTTKYRIKNAPALYLEGLPIYDAPMSGIQIFALQPNDLINIAYINMSDSVGITLITGATDALHILLNTEPVVDKDIEYRDLFKNVKHAISNNNYLVTDIARTWIYLNNINNYYENFNQARRDFFNYVEIDYSVNSSALPASTCVGGRGNNSSSCMQILCVNKKDDNLAVTRVYNDLQNEAEGDQYKFKSTFSRGLILERKNVVELQISGTASINKSGETIHVNDPYKQIEYTLKNIENILKKANMDFEDLCVSTCFFKEPQYYAFYKELKKKLKIENIPCNHMVGDICRTDLLFEFDGIAVKQK